MCQHQDHSTSGNNRSDWEQEARLQDRLYPDLQGLLDNMFVNREAAAAAGEAAAAGTAIGGRQNGLQQLEDLIFNRIFGTEQHPHQQQQQQQQQQPQQQQQQQAGPSAPPMEEPQSGGEQNAEQDTAATSPPPPPTENRPSQGIPRSCQQCTGCNCNNSRGRGESLFGRTARRRWSCNGIPEEMRNFGMSFVRNGCEAVRGFGRMLGLLVLLMILPRPLLALGIGYTIARSMPSLPVRPVMISGIFWIGLMSLGDILMPLLAGFVVLRCCIMNRPFIDSDRMSRRPTFQR